MGMWNNIAFSPSFCLNNEHQKQLQGKMVILIQINIYPALSNKILKRI
uniref:Uncharacterized protein n=1 Tax=Rhizophora mucronata TaxID=61149 RepID=A0A2P2QS33_RHIMU